MDEQNLPPPAPAPQPVSGQLLDSKQTSVTAIVSLVAGILGWSIAPWLGSIVAIITGHMARAEIRRNPETKDGDVMAVIGLVLGWSMMICSVLAVIAIVLFFGGLAAFIAVVGANSH